MQRVNYKIILVALISFLLGVWGKGVIANLEFFTFNRDVQLEVDLLGPVAILINIILAVYIARSISLANEKDRIKNSLVIGYINSFQENLERDFAKLQSLDQIDCLETKSTFKKLRMTLNSLLTLITDQKIIDEREKLLSETQTCLGNIWEAMTDTPKKSDRRSTKRTKEEREILRTEKLLIAHSHLDQMRGLLFRLIVKLK